MGYNKFDYENAISAAYEAAYMFEQKSSCGDDYFKADDKERKSMARKDLLDALSNVGYSDMATCIGNGSKFKKLFNKDVNLYVQDMLRLYKLSNKVDK